MKQIGIYFDDLLYEMFLKGMLLVSFLFFMFFYIYLYKILIFLIEAYICF
jgi:hypothetical protein